MDVCEDLLVVMVFEFSVEFDAVKLLMPMATMVLAARMMMMVMFSVVSVVAVVVVMVNINVIWMTMIMTTTMMSRECTLEISSFSF